MDEPSSSAAAATVWTLADACSAAAATAVDCVAESVAVVVRAAAVLCNSVAADETTLTIPPIDRSNTSARFSAARLRSAAIASSARRRASASSIAFRATMRLMPSTARPTAPISSPRAA
jgi:hypothetical protein